MLKKNYFIQRCFDLAKLGSGRVSPNPMVGAVITSGNKIIGEGFHEAYGEAHAEVQAANSVSDVNRNLLGASVMYVSLEPCCIFGNTPPCTKLIIDLQIPNLNISVKDFTKGVSGKGIQQLIRSNVSVETGLLEEKGRKVAAYRNTFVTKKRPYIILKYAKSPDDYISRENQQVWITNNFSKRLVHKWRSVVDAVLIGTNTARIDNPELTTRYNFGKSPIRMVLDRNLKLDRNLRIFDGQAPTVIFTQKESNEKLHNVKFVQIKNWTLNEILLETGKMKITSLIVEGGQKLLKSFINENLWEEARIFTGEKNIGSGVPAPKLPGQPSEKHQLDGDILEIFTNESPAG